MELAGVHLTGDHADHSRVLAVGLDVLEVESDDLIEREAERLGGHVMTLRAVRRPRALS